MMPTTPAIADRLEQLVGLFETDSGAQQSFLEVLNHDLKALNHQLSNPPSIQGKYAEAIKLQEVLEEEQGFMEERVGLGGDGKVVSWERATQMDNGLTRSIIQNIIPAKKRADAAMKEIQDMAAKQVILKKFEPSSSANMWDPIIAEAQKRDALDNKNRVKKLLALQRNWVKQIELAHFDGADLIGLDNNLKDILGLLEYIATSLPKAGKTVTGILVNYLDKTYSEFPEDKAIRESLCDNLQVLKSLKKQWLHAAAMRLRTAVNVAQDLWCDDAVWLLFQDLKKILEEDYTNLEHLKLLISQYQPTKKLGPQKFQELAKRYKENSDPRHRYIPWGDGVEMHRPILTYVEQGIVFPAALRDLVIRGDENSPWLRARYFRDSDNLVIINQAAASIIQFDTAKYYQGDNNIDLEGFLKEPAFANALEFHAVLQAERTRIEVSKPTPMQKKIFGWIPGVEVAKEAQFFEIWEDELNRTQKSVEECCSEIARRISESVEQALLNKLQEKVFSFPAEDLRKLEQFMMIFGTREQKKKFFMAMDPVYVFARFNFKNKSLHYTKRKTINTDAALAYKQYCKKYLKANQASSIERLMDLVQGINIPKDTAEDIVLKEDLMELFLDIPNKEQEALKMIRYVAEKYIFECADINDPVAFHFLERNAPRCAEVWAGDRASSVVIKFAALTAYLKLDGEQPEEDLLLYHRAHSSNPAMEMISPAQAVEYLKELKAEDEDVNRQTDYFPVIQIEISSYVDEIYSGRDVKNHGLMAAFAQMKGDKNIVMRYLAKRVEYLFSHGNNLSVLEASSLNSADKELLLAVKDFSVANLIIEKISSSYSGKNLNALSIVDFLNDPAVLTAYMKTRLQYLYTHKLPLPEAEFDWLKNQLKKHPEVKVNFREYIKIDAASPRSWDLLLAWLGTPQEITEYIAARIEYLAAQEDFSEEESDEDFLSECMIRENGLNMLETFIIDHYQAIHNPRFAQYFKPFERKLSKAFSLAKLKSTLETSYHGTANSVEAYLSHLGSDASFSQDSSKVIMELFDKSVLSGNFESVANERFVLTVEKLCSQEDKEKHRIFMLQKLIQEGDIVKVKSYINVVKKINAINVAQPFRLFLSADRLNTQYALYEKMLNKKQWNAAVQILIEELPCPTLPRALGEYRFQWFAEWINDVRDFMGSFLRDRHIEGLRVHQQNYDLLNSESSDMVGFFGEAFLDKVADEINARLTKYDPRENIKFLPLLKKMLSDEYILRRSDHWLFVEKFKAFDAFNEIILLLNERKYPEAVSFYKKIMEDISIREKLAQGRNETAATANKYIKSMAANFHEVLCEWVRTKISKNPQTAGECNAEFFSKINLPDAVSRRCQEIIQETPRALEIYNNLAKAIETHSFAGIILRFEEVILVRQYLAKSFSENLIRQADDLLGILEEEDTAGDALDALVRILSQDDLPAGFQQESNAIFKSFSEVADSYELKAKGLHQALSERLKASESIADLSLESGPWCMQRTNYLHMLAGPELDGLSNLLKVSLQKLFQQTDIDIRKYTDQLMSYSGLFNALKSVDVGLVKDCELWLESVLEESLKRCKKYEACFSETQNIKKDNMFLEKQHKLAKSAIWLKSFGRAHEQIAINTILHKFAARFYQDILRGQITESGKQLAKFLFALLKAVGDLATQINLENMQPLFLQYHDHSFKENEKVQSEMLHHAAVGGLAAFVHTFDKAIFGFFIEKYNLDAEFYEKAKNLREELPLGDCPIVNTGTLTPKILQSLLVRPDAKTELLAASIVPPETNTEGAELLVALVLSARVHQFLSREISYAEEQNAFEELSQVLQHLTVRFDLQKGSHFLKIARDNIALLQPFHAREAAELFRGGAALPVKQLFKQKDIDARVGQSAKK